jgi:hypothetical protein
MVLCPVVSNEQHLASPAVVVVQPTGPNATTNPRVIAVGVNQVVERPAYWGESMAALARTSFLERLLLTGCIACSRTPLQKIGERVVSTDEVIASI